jgi:quercetin dioxygenase-like cupin family protein
MMTKEASVAKAMQTARIDAVEKVKTGHGMTRFLIRNPKGEGANIMVRYWGPETNIPVHSHPYDEMWYVLEGEVEFGDETFTEGAVIYIPAGVPYGPTRAPKGVALLRYAEGAGE